MGTVSKLLEIANRCIGTKENPPDSNNVRFNTWYYGHEVNGPRYPWCMVFCQWVYSQADVGLPIRTASCGAMKTAAIEKNQYVKTGFKPGDLVLITFNGSSAPQHCGIITSVDKNYIYTIEGNTGNTSQDNGGNVMSKKRTYSQIVGAVRPVFEEEIDMTVDEFIAKLTPKQAYDLMKKAEIYADMQRLPSYAEKEGYWKKLMDDDVIRNNAPEGHLKRVELATILGRMGLIKDAK